MGTYHTTDGERISQSVLDTRIRKAKAYKKMEYFDEHGYYACEDCGMNENVGMIDMSHDISVQKCKDMGSAELAYDVDNLTLRCRDCHMVHDGFK